MIILNERKYAEEIIERGYIETNRDINVLTKYYNEYYDMTKSEISSQILEFDVLEHFIPFGIVYHVVDNTLIKRPYREVELLEKGVFFKKSELDYISSFKSLNEQKILFVLFAISQLYNNSFFFKKYEIIKFAHLPKNSQSYLEKIIRKFISNGVLSIGIYRKNYLGFGNDSHEIRYHISDATFEQIKSLDKRDKKDKAYEIEIDADEINDDFILYYLDYIGKAKVGYCETCGSIFEQSRNGRRKYCDKCKNSY